MNKLRNILLFLLLAFSFKLSALSLFAQEDNKLVTLTKQIIEAKTYEDLYVPFEELRDLYFRENKYSEFVVFLNSLKTQKKIPEPFINYYVALARYHQLKYFEENQLWDEYFSQGNIYRDELTLGAKNAIDATKPNEALYVYARLLLWQFHKDQEDVFVESSWEDLMSSILEYAKLAKASLPIKVVADKLLQYNQKSKSRELYKIYTDKVIISDIKDEELASSALAFYKEGNLDLAQGFYDVYIERITKADAPKEELISVLMDIAKLFSYKDEGANDMLYAEKIFKKIEGLAGKEVFNHELLYMRAFNLEKAKEYMEAKNVYNDLIQAYPESSYSDEAVFKVGIINTYILRDIKSGKSYFERLAKRGKLSPQVISSLYQQGLLSQWEGDSTQAKDYYNKLIDLAGDGFQETVELANHRLKEIEEAKPLEYNLKTFLDVSLKEEYTMFDMTKLDLKASVYRLKKEEHTNIESFVYLPESGCMQVELQYLWSGHTGKAKPSLNQSSFDTSYASSGTKEINLVVVSASGVIDRHLNMVDVY